MTHSVAILRARGCLKRDSSKRDGSKRDSSKRDGSNKKRSREPLGRDLERGHGESSETRFLSVLALPKVEGWRFAEERSAETRKEDEAVMNESKTCSLASEPNTAMETEPCDRARRVGFLSLALLVGGLTFVASAMAISPVSAQDGASVSELKKDLKKSLGKNQRAAMNIINELAARDSAAAIDAICDYSFRVDNPELERFAILRLREVPKDGEAVERMAHLCNKHKDFRVRIALTIALQNRKESVALTAIVQNVYDRIESVKLASLDTIRKIGTLQAIETLIEALQNEEDKGRRNDAIAGQIRLTLSELTNMDFLYAADWKNFWTRNKEGFKKPESKQERKKSSTTVRREPPTFFGGEVLSKRFLFLLDVSGSMSKKDPLPEEEGTKSGARTSVPGAKKKPKQEEIPDHRRRLSRVQKELIKVIAGLEKDVQFNIVTFNHEVGEWKPKLVFATERNKRAAIDFVKGFQPQGETHTDEALARALEHANINSIILLSDGAPRRDNELLETVPILRWLRDENRYRRIRIHAVTFEQCGKSLRKFMQSIARQHNGSYQEIK